MRRRFGLFLILLLGFTASVTAQAETDAALVKGRLTDEVTDAIAPDVQVTIPYLKLLTVTDGAGTFSFTQVPYGTYTVVIGSDGTNSDTMRIVVNKKVVDLGDIKLAVSDGMPVRNMQIPTIALEDINLDTDDEGASSQNISGLLTAGRDPFLNAVAYTFGPFRFRARGYPQNEQQVFINGAPVNDVETGNVFWGQWGGLNDVFRGKSSSYGLQPSEYAFGGINGAVYFDATAANQRKQTRITYSFSNRQYRNRLMLTHSSGLMQSGWAYSLSLSRRWAKEGYIEGTFYDGYSYYAAVSKRLGTKHTFNLTAFGAPTKRGKANPSYREAYDILDNNFYNPNWGYQNGEKRNARVADNHQPVFLLNYEYTGSNLKWNTSVGYQSGKNKNSTLDWYNASDPRPDYYKYLPGFYLINNPTTQPNPEAAEAVRRAFIHNPQIKWDELYHANKLNRQAIPNPDGTFSSDSALRSLYVTGNDVEDVKKWMFSTTLQKIMNEHITLAGGIGFIKQQTESYREMADLLGGDFFLNVNSFTERNFAGQSSFSQNDQNHPNQIIKEGDKYYYDYILRFSRAWGWGQALFTYNKLDFFIAAHYGSHSFQREGLFRNGLFAEGNQSFGKGEKQSFAIYGLKGGVTYKLNGRNYFFVNAGLAAGAPSVDNTHFSARIRNAVVENPVTEKSYTGEGGYLHRSPKANVRVAGYVTDRKDGVELQRFFYTGTGSSNSMVAYVLQNVNTRSIGTELALEYKFSAAWAVTGIAALGQAYYTSNPDVTIHNENFVDSFPIREKTYFNNYYIGVGPQSAYTLGFNYRSPHYWFANVNFNYFDRNYMDIAAPRRTEQTVELVPPGSEQWHAILDQERFPSAFTMDVFVYKSLLLSKSLKFLPRNTFLYISIGINNLLDNKGAATNGFENTRFDYAGGSVDKFAPRLYYAYGRSYFLNLALKF